jgi:hypothetical protein
LHPSQPWSILDKPDTLSVTDRQTRIGSRLVTSKLKARVDVVAIEVEHNYIAQHVF